VSIGAPIRTQGPREGATIFDAGAPGRRASAFPPSDVPPASIASEHRRGRPPALPEVAEIDLVRHYTALAQRTYGVDTGFYPLGSCSMKYNPKVSESMAALPGFSRLHPLQPDRTVQGTLELLWRLEQALCRITGMARATLQPPAGACGELTGLLMMRAYHQARQGDPRETVLIPEAAHGTNPASVRIGGYRAVTVPADERGLVDLAALERLVDDRVAGLMLTNPNTLGVFERQIEAITGLVHGAGGLVYYDGANLNAIMGRARPGDMGFDIVHINTHKTFATPHGGGGPGAGPVGVIEELVPYLPVPRVERRDDGAFALEHDVATSIGRMHGFHGNVAVLVRAYAYVAMHGREGLARVSDHAVLNANYLAALLRDVFPAVSPEPAMHEFVASAVALKDETGMRAMDIAKRLIDLGYHPSTVYFPLVVEEALMVEPTETESRQTLEGFSDAVHRAVTEAHDEPDLLRAAPVTTPVRRLDEARAARELRLRWTPPGGG
jgi:glycine dehydrogenase subunit 2